MKLRLKGWRGRAMAINLPRRLLLAGPNGSGKTNILDAVAVALTGEAPARLGKSAARMVPYLEDAATTRIEGADPFWSATTAFRKTAKSAKFEQATDGTPPRLRPLFVDFGLFLDAPAERKRLLDGLIELSEASIGTSAREGAQRGALKVLAPAMKEWDHRCLDQFEGEAFARFKGALVGPEKAGLDEALAELSAKHKAGKAMLEEAAKQPVGEDTRDSAIITAEIAELRTTVAKVEAQDRDAKATHDRRAALEARLGKLQAVQPGQRAQLEAQLKAAQSVELAPRTSPQLALDCQELNHRIEQLRADFAKHAGGKCPTCGHPIPKDQEALDKISAQGQALKAQLANTEQALTEAREAEAKQHQKWSEAQAQAASLRQELAVLPVGDADEVKAIVAELENLPARFASGVELDAMRLRLRNLEQEAEVARQAHAAVALGAKLNLPALELAGKALRAAQKGWEQGKAEAFAAVVGPIAKRMGEALRTTVAIDPGDNWAITVKDRPAESYSGGQRLAIWGAFVGALAKAGDVLLCEAAEADLVHLSDMLDALAGCPADLVIVATHHEVGAQDGWEVLNPAEVSHE